ncbi:hypothetical protein JW933_01705 [candidate division FCPU426 bacterium]|nr:hypothetical protein [candidate division FCPU426 bacterium]
MAYKILVPGSVVLDVYEDTGKRYLGGAEFNFAYHMHHLLGGVDFIARLGQDEAGRHILSECTQRGFPVKGMQTDPVKPTKTVRIQKDANNEPIFFIPDDVATEYLDYPPLTDADIAAYHLVYFGTTLQHGAKSRSTLRALLDKCRGVKFCDLNLRSGKYTRETIAYSLHTCDFLKLNHEELETASDLFSLTGCQETRILKLKNAFNLSGVCLTLAAKGSLLATGNQLARQSGKKCSVLDTVGAGDAFSACLAVGLLQQLAASDMLALAADFATAVCNIQGAVPADASFYRPWQR